MSTATTSHSETPTDAREIGFRSLGDETRVDRLPVIGHLPDWLRGSLLRTGPARWEVGEQELRHWFDGLAMLHRFSFDRGTVSYQNRFLHTRAWRAATEQGELSYSEFATDPCRSLFQRLSSVFSPALTDNANVNLTRLGERFIAMTETPLPVQFDPRTLAAAGVPFTAPGHLATAHPHLDRASGAMLNFAAKLGPRSSYRFYRVAPEEAAEPEVLASEAMREPAYMHSFGLSDRWFVLVEFPFVVNPLRLAASGRPFIENFRWKPERGTRVHLFDRRTGAHAGPFETEPCFAFHHVAAYDEGDEIVVDLCTFPDAGIVEDLYLERLRAGKPIASAALERWRVAPGAGTVARERLSEESLELPRINYGRCNERPYRYVYGVGSRGGWLDRIVKADVQERRSAVWEEPGAYPGEPVFVAAPQAREEDEGVLLSIVLEPSGTSSLLVLDAATLTELGRAQVPHHIPFGFHGQFSGSVV